MILGFVDISHGFALKSNKACLKDGCLVLAVGSVKSRETRACSIGIVTDTSSRAVTSSLVAISVKRIGTRRALLELAGGSSISGIAEASNVFHVVPRGIVGPARFDSQVLLGPASTTVVTVVRASGTLACNTIIAREARACAGLAVARPLVGALDPGMQVVGVDHLSDPSKVAGASAKRAVGTSPFRLSIQAGEALAVVVLLTGSVVGAVILAESSIAVAALVPNNLSPRLGSICRSTGRSGFTVTNHVRSLDGVCSIAAISPYTCGTVRVGRANLASVSEGLTVSSQLGAVQVSSDIVYVCGVGSSAAHSGGC